MTFSTQFTAPAEPTCQYSVLKSQIQNSNNVSDLIENQQNSLEKSMHFLSKKFDEFLNSHKTKLFVVIKINPETAPWFVKPYSCK